MSSRRRLIVTSCAALVVLGAAIVVVISAISTSTARVTASTTGSSFFAAGTIDLSQPDSAVDLLFDTDGLYPGLDARGCVVIEYNGSLPVDVRLHASTRGGTGLEEFVELELRLRDSTTCDGDAADDGTGRLRRPPFESCGQRTRPMTAASRWFPRWHQRSASPSMPSPRSSTTTRPKASPRTSPSPSRPDHERRRLAVDRSMRRARPQTLWGSIRGAASFVSWVYLSLVLLLGVWLLVVIGRPRGGARS